MDVATGIVIAILVYIAIQVTIGLKRGDNPLICSTCGTCGKAKTVTKGSMGLEFVLWLCFLVPGLIYSIWRLTTRHDVCGACGANSLVPLSSPVGRELAAKYQEIP